ncbi:hypothetical protein FV219_05330 [Methylobacterium sp. WL122]|nr:hypothetical protein FV219_05330 [Methylobacterium sp. WL122]
MTPREQLAHDAGLRAALHMARTVAITMETAADATDLRKQAAVAALYAFAESAEALALAPTVPPAVLSDNIACAIPHPEHSEP